MSKEKEILERIENSEIILNIKKYNELYENKLSEANLNKKLIEAIEKLNIPHVKVELDDNGNMIIDKDKDPDLYDWWLNG